MTDAASIAGFRAFNRFFTSRIGVLKEGMHDSPYTLTEARVIYELGMQQPVKAGELGRELGMDKAQLSRVLQRLKRQGLLASRPDNADKRAARLSLTPKGQELFQSFDQKSSEQLAQLLAPLAENERQRLMQSFREVTNLLGDTPPRAELALRGPRLGDYGRLIARQAVVYHEQFGWNQDFEGLIARIYAEYHEALTDKKALWIAELDGRMAGSIFVAPAKDQPDVAQLRMLYVEPFARGRGIGAKLVDEVVRYSKQKGYKSIILWTQDCLTSARRIYQGAGFELVKQDPHHSFGQDLNGQYWRLELSDQ